MYTPRFQDCVFWWFNHVKLLALIITLRAVRQQSVEKCDRSIATVRKVRKIPLGSIWYYYTAIRKRGHVVAAAAAASSFNLIGRNFKFFFVPRSWFPRASRHNRSAIVVNAQRSNEYWPLPDGLRKSSQRIAAGISVPNLLNRMTR